MLAVRMFPGLRLIWALARLLIRQALDWSAQARVRRVVEDAVRREEVVGVRLDREASCRLDKASHFVGRRSPAAGGIERDPFADFGRIRQPDSDGHHDGEGNTEAIVQLAGPRDRLVITK